MFVSGPDDVITCCAARAGGPEPSAAAMASSSAPAVMMDPRQRSYLEAIKFPLFANSSMNRAPHAGAAAKINLLEQAMCSPLWPSYPPLLLIPHAVWAQAGGGSSRRVFFRGSARRRAGGRRLARVRAGAALVHLSW